MLEQLYEIWKALVAWLEVLLQWLEDIGIL